MCVAEVTHRRCIACHVKYQGSWHPWCCCGGRVMRHVASVWRAQSPSTHLLKFCNRQQVISEWIRQVGGAGGMAHSHCRSSHRGGCALDAARCAASLTMQRSTAAPNAMTKQSEGGAYEAAWCFASGCPVKAKGVRPTVRPNAGLSHSRKAGAYAWCTSQPSHDSVFDDAPCSRLVHFANLAMVAFSHGRTSWRAASARRCQHDSSAVVTILATSSQMMVHNRFSVTKSLT